MSGSFGARTLFDPRTALNAKPDAKSIIHARRISSAISFAVLSLICALGPILVVQAAAFSAVCPAKHHVVGLDAAVGPFNGRPSIVAMRIVCSNGARTFIGGE